jgi:hypothetical protein
MAKPKLSLTEIGLIRIQSLAQGAAFDGIRLSAISELQMTNNSSVANRVKPRVVVAMSKAQ